MGVQQWSEGDHESHLIAVGAYMMLPSDSMSTIFDDSHYASTIPEKTRRSLQLGVKYYFRHLPLYFYYRHKLNIPLWDLRVFINPLKEFGTQMYSKFPLPPGYQDALQRLGETGARLALPRVRLEALLGAWWATRKVPGDMIECGAYRGATSLLIALLGKMNRIEQMTLMLDTFRGIPQTSKYDLYRKSGEYWLPEDQVSVIWQQASALGIQDRIEIHQGLFSETFATLQERDLQFAFVHIDANIYQGTWEACEFTIPRTRHDGIVVFDDYNGMCDLGARLAINRYFAGRNVEPVLLAVSSAYVRVQGADSLE